MFIQGFSVTDPFSRLDDLPRGTGLAARAQSLVRPRAADYLDKLNPGQREAVETLDGPVLVLAGAGTGKTRVLTTRIAHILATQAAWPSQILAVTFTNKAAREMKDRLRSSVGDTAEGISWLGTFHAIGTRMLRRHAELAGLRPDFTILGTDDQIRLLKQILSAENIDEKRWPARQLAGLIDGWKNRALTPDKVSASQAGVFANGRGPELYALYQERLKTLNAADFGDLLLAPIGLFRSHPDILESYHQRFKFILVDEYQDTNVAQYLWLRLLAQGSRNVCCVGDDDQSIYGWRGAEVENILRFEQDFPGARVIRLEQNYRSDGHILGAASFLISHNEDRLGKTLHGQGNDGEMVTVTGAWDSGEEARAIGEEVEQLQHQGHNLSSMAILVRASFQMREFEERFLTMGLNYRVIGGPRFYERAEIRDALAYLRCVANAADDLAFERIVNVPKRGFGDGALKTLSLLARESALPLLPAAKLALQGDHLKGRARTSLKELVASFDRWTAQMDTIKHTELAEIVLEESGYTDMWKNERSPDAAGRLENLKELVRSMDSFENLAGFLEHVSLVMEVENNAEGEAITIMTLHAAKGLEFDTVFLPGWEEGLFPHQRSLDESGRAGLEEERRLAYVGLTRARKRAKVYFASNRRVHGLWQSSLPSRFLDELPQAHVEVVEAPAAFSQAGFGTSRFNRPDFSTHRDTPGWQRAQAFTASPKNVPSSGPTVIEGEIIARSTGPSSGFAVGARVFHEKFGYGIVEDSEGNKLTVTFQTGTKRVLDSFLKAG
jgi:DNA helicase II / ATP-dependent DNA helicase PcrA